jgi:hypothetical protein
MGADVLDADLLGRLLDHCRVQLNPGIVTVYFQSLSGI